MLFVFVEFEVDETKALAFLSLKWSLYVMDLYWFIFLLFNSLGDFMC